MDLYATVSSKRRKTFFGRAPGTPVEYKQVRTLCIMRLIEQNQKSVCARIHETDDYKQTKDQKWPTLYRVLPQCFAALTSFGMTSKDKG